MAEEEQKILIQVDYETVNKYAEAAVAAKDKVDLLKKANAELKDGGKATAAQIAASNAEVKAADKEYKNATATLQKMVAANKATGTSYDDLYKQWQAGERQLKSMTGTIIQNADGSYKLSDAYIKQKTSVDNAKKALDNFGQGIHNNTLNVGNYIEGMKLALKQTGLFGNAFGVIDYVKNKFSGAVEGVKNFGKSFSTLKGAIASTGIGLLIIAIGSLVTWFTKTAEGSKVVKQAMAAVGEVFKTLVGTLGKVGGLLKDVFTVNWSELRNDVKALGDEWSNVGKNIKTAIELANLDLKIGKEKRKNIIDEAELTRDIAKLRLDAADKTKSMAERSNALKKSLELEKKLAKEKIDLADLEYEKAYKTIRLRESHGGKASAEEKDAFANAIAARANAEQSEYDRSKRATSQLTAFYKEQQQIIYNDKKSRLEAEGILAGDDYKKLQKNLRDTYNLEITQADLTENQKYLLSVKLDQALNELDNKRLKEQAEKDKEYVEFTKQLNDDVESSFADMYKNVQAQHKADSDARIETRRIEANGNLDILRDILDDEYTNLTQSEEYKQASTDKKALMDAQYADQRMKISQQIVDFEAELDAKALENKRQTFAATADLLGNMSDLLGKNTLAGKSLAIAQATINTYLAASQALASAPNPIIGAIQMAAAIAMGLIQVKQIMAVKVSKTGGGGGAASSGTGQTLSSTFTAASPRVATSQAAASQSGAIGVAQQGDAQAAKAGNATAQALQNNPPVLYVDTFEAKQNEKNAVSVKANV